MGRTARDNRDLPHPRPVQKIVLSEENTVLRLIAAVLCLLVGAGALTYAFQQLLAPDSGWQEIEAGVSGGPTCGEDFVFLYELGAGEQPLSAESRALNALYTEACRTAFRLFHTVQSFEGVVNLYDINARPNEVLTVDPALYAAFEAVEAAGDRTVYLGPVCARYGDLFACRDDSQLADFDPWSSVEVAEEYAAVAAYAADPAHIGVELLGENRVRLRVSEEYLAYARREGAERFLDFGWMKNAFVADYLADTLAQAGFTHGILYSFDGFARCLDEREGSYTLSLYGWEGERPIVAGTMEYQGPMSVASLCAFPVTEGDWRRFYQMQDGRLRTPYLDVSDGRSRTAADCLVCYSPAHGCAGLAMGAAPAFIADTLREELLRELAGSGVRYIWCRDRTLYSSDPEPAVANLYGGYTLEASPCA